MKNQGDEPVIIGVGTFTTIIVTSHCLKTIKSKERKQAKRERMNFSSSPCQFSEINTKHVVDVITEKK